VGIGRFAICGEGEAKARAKTQPNVVADAARRRQVEEFLLGPGATRRLIMSALSNTLQGTSKPQAYDHRSKGRAASEGSEFRQAV
jgi:hypothetical protein